MKPKLLALLTSLSLFMMVASCVVSVTTSFGGQSVASGTNSAQSLIVPAGYAFSIWTPIYLGLLIYAILQLLPRNWHNPRYQKANPWVIVNAWSNALWLPAASFGMVWLTVGFIIPMLVSLVFINHHLQIGRVKVPAAEAWLVRLPMSIYFGWVTLATALNIAAYLVDIGWDGGFLAPEIWTVVIMAVAFGIAMVVYLKVANLAYILVVVWAFAAIAVARANDYPLIYWAALSGVAIALLAALAYKRLKPGFVSFI